MPKHPDDTPDRIHMHNLRPGDVALLKDIAEAAAGRAVHQMLVSMGLNPDQPLASQRDFIALREMASRTHDQDAIADRAWVRRTRQRSEGILGKAVATAVGIAVLGAGHAIWTGIVAIAAKASHH